MIRVLFILFATVILADAQIITKKRTVVAAAPSSWSPTNNSDGVLPLAWYPLDYMNSTYTNSSGQLTNWPDAYTNAWRMTNMTGSGTALISNNWRNGKSAVIFNGTDSFVTSQQATSSQPFEVVMVGVIQWDGVTADPFFCGNSYLFTSGGTLLRAFAGSNRTLSSLGSLTNVWAFYEITFNDTSTTAYTNNVQTATGASGSGTMSRFAVGASSDFTAYSRLQVCEVQIWAPPLTGTARQNRYTYLTNKFGVP